MMRDSGLGTRDSALLEATVAHLRALVGFDTRNPPRAIGTGGIFHYLRAQLPGFDVEVSDHGAGAVSLFATRGKPKLLFNVHLDTVPDSKQWSASPFELRVAADRAIGLGACDIKGAAAALLAAANASQGDMALLFTSDEEGADPRCIRAFLRDAFLPPLAGEGAEGGWGKHFEEVIVAEPTRCHAVLAHRGIQSVRVGFAGRAGHASGAQKPSDNALHQAVRWGSAALDFADSQSNESFGGLHGMRFNIGRIEGGIKANMIAPAAELRCGMRPLPSVDMDGLLERLRTLAEPAPAVFEETFRGPPLPADAANAASHLRNARALADALEIPVGNAVDFWTEAALFSRAGCTTFVYGPGDIAQAHSADEWVALDDLETAARTYLRITEPSP
ncbi:MAG: N-acetyl-L-citrulline deacetylase [Rhodanobacteraceae bacterium]|jgi:acetylornithine deacetylase|nr:MAG: N-acetyl-L-citrulline deacetylase [Rhodanobacteraceae bacterium]